MAIANITGNILTDSGIATSSLLPYTGATANVNLGVYSLTANQLIAGGASTDNVATLTTYDQGHALKLKGSTGDLFFVPYFSPSIGARITAQNSAASANTPLSFYASNFYFNSNVNFGSTLGNGTYTYTLPSATGTLALTSNLSAYLPLTGGTLTGALSGTSATFSGNVGIGNNVADAINSASGLGNLVVGNGGGSSQGITIYTNSSTYGGLNFADATSGGGAYAGYIKFDHTNDSMGFFIGNTQRLSIASTGAATFSSSLSATDGIFSGEVYNTTTGAFFIANAIANAAYPTYGFYNNAGVGMYRPSADVLGFVTSSTERMRITSGGNVGIGTSSPAAKLDVNGGINSNTFITNSTSTTINSSTNVNTAVLDCGIVIYRDRTNGGGCVVFYENGQTPIIISQSGPTTYTTTSPSSNQIQLSNRSGARGIAAIGGSSRNGVALGWAVFRTEGGDA